MQAPTTKKAADDGSPGTSRSMGVSPPAGARPAPRRGSASRRRPDGGQEPFGVVTGQGRLGHLGGAGGLEAGQQQRRLHLGAGHRPVRGACPGRSPPRIDSGVSGPPSRPSMRAPMTPQRVDHPAHGPAGDRRVAGQHGVERPAGQEPGQQPDRGPGVAAVDDGLGLDEPVEATAPDDDDRPDPLPGHAASPGSRRRRGP